MPDWSDGRVRSENFKGSELAREISRYFETPRDRLIDAYTRENNELKQILEELNSKPKAKGATA